MKLTAAILTLFVFTCTTVKNERSDWYETSFRFEKCEDPESNTTCYLSEVFGGNSISCVK